MLVHAHDAADLRLRSREDIAAGLPTRSRASNVLAQVLTLYVGDHRISWPTELVALGSKDADTLVTALETRLREISDKAGFAFTEQASAGGVPASGGAVPAKGGGVPARAGGVPAVSGAGFGAVWTWLLHILLQDGINTNMAAAASLRVVIAKKQPLGPRVRYFLVAMTCAAHSANLVTCSVVQGEAAKIGDVRKTDLHSTVCSNTVRLFKYLLSDYWEEFVASTRDWVEETLLVRPWDKRDTVMRTACVDSRSCTRRM